MIVLVIFLGLFLLLSVLFFFATAAKHADEEKIAPLKGSFAHRGLFDETMPENSLPAFLKAAEMGFGIELDVQLSADGEVFVFHDYTLDRMCGVEGKLSALPAEALKKHRLAGSDCTIPTLSEVLAAVDGRVPLLIELKGESGDNALAPRVVEVLESYRGAWCVESFNPLLLRWFYKNRPDVLRGLLVTDLIREKRAGSKLLNLALSAEWLNFLCRPNFLAWDKKYERSLARQYNRTRGIPMAVYTVKTPEEYETHKKNGNAPIFDGFVPENATGK